MSVAFPKPTFAHIVDPVTEIAALRTYRDTAPGRAIPARTPHRLLLATWNVANLGVQERQDEHYRLIAEIMSWFDVVAVQEVNDNLGGIRAIAGHLPANYRLLFSDASGNDERLTFVYDPTRVRLLDEVGEIAPAPSTYLSIKLPGISQQFNGFDRNPYLATFTSGSFTFSLVNVHLYFGTESAVSKNRRSLETYAVARWADIRRRDPNAFTKDIIPLGDFNLPKVDPADPIYAALTARGLALPPHSTQIGSAIASDSHYDQVAFFPGDTAADFEQAGVFDYDGAAFRDLWTTRPQADFLAYCRYYISDHRPLWAAFKT
jgi:endonuclease/exonuclease/phosphatase family metal-dependent hydrolase